jgi:hypothetical protein
MVRHDTDRVAARGGQRGFVNVSCGTAEQGTNNIRRFPEMIRAKCQIRIAITAVSRHTLVSASGAPPLAEAYGTAGFKERTQ